MQKTDNFQLIPVDSLFKNCQISRVRFWWPFRLTSGKTLISQTYCANNMPFNHLFRCGIALLFIVYSAMVQADSRSADYRLAAGDAIRVLVFQNQDLTLETRVSDGGTITYPLVGTVRVGGLTISGAEQALAKALQEGNFVNKPQVTIVLIENRGNQVSVLGAVNRPGRYPLDNSSTKISEILALAGGIAPSGSDSVILTGIRGGKAYRRIVDVAGLYLNDKPNDDAGVSAGDTIYVHRAPLFYIYGEVQRPGSYRVERGMTVMQGLAQGGGLTPRGTERGLKLQRKDELGKVQEISPVMSDAIQPDDVIYVKESIL